MAGRRYAILIASSQFPEEVRLDNLRLPENDVDGLGSVLSSEDRGQFTDVIILKNRTSSEVQRNINQVLSQADRDDLVLIYFSGHGKLNRIGQLHLATVDTVLDTLESTSVPVQVIKNFIDVSPSSTVILILDCCYSGAIGAAFSRSSTDDQLQLMSGGRGTYIMTASTGVQVAVEKEGEQYGVFTKQLIDGIEGDEADADGDGYITMDELYAYVRGKIREEGAQEPMKWDLNVAGGDLVISKSGRISWMERRNQIRERVLDLARQGVLPNPIVARALEIIDISPDQLTAVWQPFDVLLDQLLQNDVTVGDFIHQWYQAGPESSPTGLGPEVVEPIEFDEAEEPPTKEPPPEDSLAEGESPIIAPPPPRHPPPTDPEPYSQPPHPSLDTRLLARLSVRQYGFIGAGIITAVAAIIVVVASPWSGGELPQEPKVVQKEVVKEPEAPADTPAQAEQPAAPTAEPQAAAPPAVGQMAGPKTAPSFASYWHPPTEFYGEPVYGGTLRINYEDPLEHANVWGAISGDAIGLRMPTTDALIHDDPYDAGAPFIPGLAHGWEIHGDLEGVMFFLREEVKWHNGADFTCEDARFSYQTMITGEGLTNSYMKFKLPDLDVGGIECLDEFTLNFRTTKTLAVPLLGFANAGAMIFNKEWFLAGGEDAMFQDLSVGVGPFIWAEGQTVGGDMQRFEKNPDYYLEGVPYVDELVIFGIRDEGHQQAAQLAHQTDWHWVRNFGQYDAYVSHDQILTVIRASRRSENLWPNQRNAPFDNRKVRQAITMGMNKAEGIAVLLDGHGSQGLGLMPPGSPWALDRERACAIPGWCPDPDWDAQRAEAIQILKEEGFDFDKVYVLTVESDQQGVGRATFAQEQLRLLGIKTDFDVVERAAFRKQTQTGGWGDFLSIRGGVGGVDDPFVGLGQYYSCPSLYNFNSPGTACDVTVEAMFAELSGIIDSAARKELGDEIQMQVMGQYWTTPYLWEQEAVAFWPEARGYVHFPTSTGSFRKYYHMWIDPDHKDNKGLRGQTSGVPGGI